MVRSFAFWLFLTLMCLATCPAFAAEMVVKRDIAYADTRNNRQTLDVYLPKDAKSAPIMIWIHGGGWRMGNKTAVQAKPQAFVDQGFVFVSVNYRLVPNVEVDGMCADIAKAIAFVHANAGERGGDVSKIFVAGHSAGAHLAALVCTDESYLKAEGLSLDNISGCIPVDTGAYDVVAQMKALGTRGNLLYKPAFSDDVATQQKFSPVTHVSKENKLPPFLILHVASRADSTARSKEFAKAINDAGGQAEVVPAENKTHGTINQDLGKPGDKPTAAVWEFLKKHMAEPGEQSSDSAAASQG